ncbi:acetyltransferase [Brasilonema bromeliae]|uniref:Acetyltransferase n=1 Tax=Brasilonema bromeliae SPC951 TaxID=385972 RepID=A0ABX1P852_9CYAN|nr:acetyltransferase [Brasilonema bromeliae]NMG20111.1 acetyltransferase [Brasilonema bromeliae SPC951]
MLLQDKQTGQLVEIRDFEALISPLKPTVAGQLQAGEEEQEPEDFKKEQLLFPSGESLPRCWIDENYKDS